MLLQRCITVILGCIIAFASTSVGISADRQKHHSKRWHISIVVQSDHSGFAFQYGTPYYSAYPYYHYYVRPRPYASFITPPPSMEYIMLPPRPTHKPWMPYPSAEPMWSIHLWHRPVWICYPTWYYDGPLYQPYPYVWYTTRPLLYIAQPPVVIIYRLRRSRGEWLAQRLRDSKLFPGVHYLGQGDKLIISGPPSVLTGVGQARIRELIKALDEEGAKTRDQSRKPQDIARKSRRLHLDIYIGMRRNSASGHGSTITKLTNLPREVRDVARAMKIQAVQLLRSDNILMDWKRPVRIEWKAPKRRSFGEPCLSGRLSIVPIATDGNNACVKLNMDATIRLPRKTTWSRHRIRTYVVGEKDKPVVIVSRHTSKDCALILRLVP